MPVPAIAREIFFEIDRFWDCFCGRFYKNLLRCNQENIKSEKIFGHVKDLK